MNPSLSRIFIEYCLALGNPIDFERIKQDFQNMSIGSLDRAFYAGKFKSLGLQPISLIQSCREIISLLPQTPPELASLLEKPKPLTTKIQKQIEKNLKLHEFHDQPFASAILEANCTQNSFVKAIQQIDIESWKNLLQQLKSQSIYDRFYVSTLETFLNFVEEFLGLFSTGRLQKIKIIQGHQRSLHYLQCLRQRGKVVQEITELLRKYMISRQSYQELITKNSLEFETLVPSLLRTSDFDFLYEKKFLTLENWEHLRRRPSQVIDQDLKHRMGLLIGIKHSFENGSIPPAEIPSLILQVIQTPENEQLQKVVHSQQANTEPLQKKREPSLEQRKATTQQTSKPIEETHKKEVSDSTKIPQKYIQAIQNLLNPIREGIQTRKEIQTTGQMALDELGKRFIAFENSLFIAEKRMKEVMLLYHERQRFQRELTILRKEVLGHVKGDTQIFVLEHTLMAYEESYRILPEEIEHVQTHETTFLEKDAWSNYIVHKYKFIHEAKRSGCNQSRLEAIEFPQKNAVLVFILGQFLNAYPLFFHEDDFILFEEKLPEPTPQNVKNARAVCHLLFQCGFSVELIKLLILSGIWSLDKAMQQQIIEKIKRAFSQRYTKAQELPELEMLDLKSLQKQIKSISKNLLENIDEHGVTIYKKISQISEHQSSKLIQDILPYEWAYFKKSLLVTDYLLRLKDILDTVIEIEAILARHSQSQENDLFPFVICQKQINSIAKLSDCDQRLELILNSSSNYFDVNGEFFSEGVDLYHQNTGFTFQ